MVTESSDGPGPAERLLQETMDKVTRAGLMMQYQKFYNERWFRKKMFQLQRPESPYRVYNYDALLKLSPEDKNYMMDKLDKDEVIKHLARADAISDLDRWVSNYKFNFDYEGDMYKSLERTFMTIRDHVQGRYIKPYEMPKDKKAVPMPELNRLHDYEGYFEKRAMRTDQSIKEA